MKIFILLLLFSFFNSCIPIAIAPNLEEGKIIRGKKFKRKLPNRYAYIFTDSKGADEFYHYINTKFTLDNNYVEDNVPIEINGSLYYVSFYETEKITQTINLIPILIDAKREQNGNDPLLEEVHSSRWGTWYILLMITAEDFSDGLNPNYKHYEDVHLFAKTLKDEYFRTTNYRQAILHPSQN